MRLSKQVEMLIAAADFMHAREELQRAEEELKQAVLQQLRETYSYNVLFPITYRVQNEYLFN